MKKIINLMVKRRNSKLCIELIPYIEINFMYFGIVHKINGGIKLNLGKEIIRDELKTLEAIENSLGELSLSIINIFKDKMEKGLIGEEEYKKHTKVKEEYLAFLQEKRKDSAAI